MTIVEIILLAIVLAMDCFTVSITCGLIQKRIIWKTSFLSAFMFGLFQALMPLLGWLGIIQFKSIVESWDHWIAFGLLTLIGGKMILDGFKKEEEYRMNLSSFKVILSLAIATSIDAFAVGLSFGCLGINTTSRIMMSILIIGVTSFVLSIAGFYIGSKIGKILKFPIEPIGGIILIAIGVKILIEHLIS